MTRKHTAMHVATTTRKVGDRVYQTHLLRRTFRKDGKVLHETLANLPTSP